MDSIIEESKTDQVVHQMTYNGGNYTSGGFFTTFSGIKFNPIAPNPDDIHIKDIAQALSNSCRFGGHVNRFYSVAQHCVHVSYLCPPEEALIGLLHDASEAYISDMVRPVKYTQAMEGYREIEQNLEKVIAKRFGLETHMTPGVKAADNETVVAEALALFNPTPDWVLDTMKAMQINFRLTECWQPPIAKARFLNRYFELIGLIEENNVKS